MGADPFSPFAPARVRVLVLPVGRIKSSRFEQFAVRLQTVTSVKLSDVASDTRTDRATFAPNGFQGGRVLLDISPSLPQSCFAELAPFELFRDVMIILGTVDAVEYEQSAGEQEVLVEDGSRNVFYHRAHDGFVSTMENVQEQFPGVLCAQLLVMDIEKQAERPWIPEDAIRVPAGEQGGSEEVYSVICEVVGKLLGEMSIYAERVKSWATVATPLSLQTQSQQAELDRRPNFSRRISDLGETPRDASPSGDVLARSGPRPTSQHFNSPTVSVASSPRPDSPALQSEAPSSPDLNSAQTPTASEGMWKARMKYASMSDKPAGRSLYPAANAAMSADKERNIGKARIGIVLGSLYLMAGRWEDAWRELIEHSSKCRSMNDCLWFVAGLEKIVICMLLLGSEGFDFRIPSLCHQAQERQSALSFMDTNRDKHVDIGPRDPVAANASLRKLGDTLGEVIATLLQYYDRAGTLNSEALPQVSYSEMILRLTKLQAYVTTPSLSAGHDDLLQDSRLNALRRPLGTSEPSDSSRAGICETLSRAYPGPFADISSSSRSAVLAGIAGVYSALSMNRKRALVLRNLISLIVPSLQQARTLGAAELGIHPSSSLSYANTKSTTTDSYGLPFSTKSMLQQLLETYNLHPMQSLSIGLDGHRDPPKEDTYAHIIDLVTQNAARMAALDDIGSINLKLDILRSSIEFCESLPDLEGVARNSALLLRVSGPQASIDPTLPIRHVSLANEEQVRLANGYLTAIATAREAGLTFNLPPYWDDFLVRSVQLVEDEKTGKLVEHAKTDLVKSKSGPFLHDAWQKRQKMVQEDVVIVNEPATIAVVLQNPYDFEMEIEEMHLYTEEGEVVVEQAPASLGPRRLEEVTCIARPTSIGRLKITACRIQMASCEEQTFPIYNDEWKADHSIRVKEASRQRFLKDIFTLSKEEREEGLPRTAQLSLTVIPEQPNIVISEMDLPDESLMLVEGEARSFQMTVLNNAQVDIDLLKISFEDAITLSLRDTRSSKDLSRADLFEVEANLKLETIFSAKRLDEEGSEHVGAGQSATFEVNMIGRAGTRDARILIDYAKLSDDHLESADRFFSRQLAIPIHVTVNSGVQIQQLDVLRLPLDAQYHEDRGQEQDGDETSAGLAAVSDPDARCEDTDTTRVPVCLLVFDLRNAWTNSIKISFDLDQSVQPSSGGATISQVILPGQSSRVAVPMRSLYVQKAYAQIPLLPGQSQRQFVVSSSDDRLELERAIRELFWYREEFLSKLGVRWEEVGSERHGEIGLRSLRLGHRMIETLKTDDVIISTTIKCSDEQDGPDSTCRTGKSSYDVECGRFLKLQTSLHNQSDRTVKAILRIQPLLPDQTPEDTLEALSRRFVWSGLLQRPTPDLLPGATVVLDLDFVIVAEGLYELRAVVEEVRPATWIPQAKATSDDDSHEDDEPDVVRNLESSERRVWRTSEPCTVRAREANV